MEPTEKHPPEWSELIEFQQKNLAIDIHVHQKDFLPPILKRIGRIVPGRALPKFMPLDKMREGYVDGCVVAMIGDFLFSLPPAGNKRKTQAKRQLKKIMLEVASSGSAVVENSAGLLRYYEKETPFFILGVEGGDLLSGNRGFLEVLRQWGVRVMSLVHFHNNALGTVNATIWRYWLGGKKVKRSRGLSAEGEATVREMNRLGIIIDLAHADQETIRDAADVSKHPIIVSHTGARSLHDFHRYLTDREIRTVADTGGLIGLWPMYYAGKGMKTPDDFSAHAAHVLKVAGEDHLAIGTDAMGVPGFMEGYGGLPDAAVLTAALFKAGLNDTQVKKAMGFNFLRVLRETEKAG